MPLDLWSPAVSYYGVGYGTCILASIGYAWIDFAQEQDPIPLGILFRNPYFLLYWLLQIAGSAVAFFLLLSYPPIQKWPSPLIALIAVFGSSLVLQNQLIKIGDRPVLDFSGLQKGLRLQVKSEAVKIAARQERRRIALRTEALAKKFEGQEMQLEQIFVQVMLLGGSKEVEADTLRIHGHIEEIKNRCRQLGLPLEYDLARIIVQTDIDFAIRLLGRR